jgi:uroporphyrinogen-III synthase
MPAVESQPLDKVRVLVTRPRDQAGRLAQLIEQAGGEVLRFPTIEIAPVDDAAALNALLARLDEFDLALFVSANAVTHALAALRRGGRAWPARLPAGAVGQATAAALRAQGVGEVLAPAGRFDAEALLELPALREVRGKRIVIFRGEGGREHLADTLRTRGARVEYAECYRRRRPDADAAPLVHALARGDLHVLTLTSVDAARHLREMLGAEAWRLRSLPAVVVSERVARACDELGLGIAPLVASAASDEAIVDALKRWRVAQKNL